MNRSAPGGVMLRRGVAWDRLQWNAGLRGVCAVEHFTVAQWSVGRTEKRYRYGRVLGGVDMGWLC